MLTLSIMIIKFRMLALIELMTLTLAIRFIKFIMIPLILMIVKPTLFFDF